MRRWSCWEGGAAGEVELLGEVELGELLGEVDPLLVEVASAEDELEDVLLPPSQTKLKDYSSLQTST